MTTSPQFLQIAMLVIALISSQLVYASEDEWDDSLDFDDSPLITELAHPEWFKESFLDLREDLLEAKAANKRGLLLYFGQKHCAYCQALMKHDFGQDDIARYTQQHFDVIAIDIWGSKEVVTTHGETMQEREFAQSLNATFTPTLIFFNLNGDISFKLPGYYPPYKFRSALEYVVEGYYRQERFSQYLLRADPPPRFEMDELNGEEFFQSPPYALDRSRFKAERPLLVFFEQGNCHACDILHSTPLVDQEIRQLIKGFDVVQLDIHTETPVWTPQGEKLSAREWAEKLDIFYTPTIVAFDQGGSEIIRIDSVAHHYRLNSVMQFILNREYLENTNFSSWRFKVIFGEKKLPEQQSQ